MSQQEEGATLQSPQLPPQQQEPQQIPESTGSAALDAQIPDTITASNVWKLNFQKVLAERNKREIEPFQPMFLARMYHLYQSPPQNSVAIIFYIFTYYNICTVIIDQHLFRQNRLHIEQAAQRNKQNSVAAQQVIVSDVYDTRVQNLQREVLQLMRDKTQTFDNMVQLTNELQRAEQKYVNIKSNW